VGTQNCISLFSSSLSKYLPILLLEAMEEIFSDPGVGFLVYIKRNPPKDQEK